MINQRALSKGFTLLEVLVVLAIMAGMFMVAYTVLGKALDDSDRLSVQAERLETEQRVLAFFTMDFEQVVARPVRDSFGDAQSPIGSLPDGGVALTRLGWANPFDLRPRSQLQRVYYSLEDGTLYRRYFDMLDINSGSEEQAVVLLEDVASFSLRYLFKDNNEQWQWYDQWPTLELNQQTTNKLLLPMPVSVELSLTMESGRELHRFFRLPVNPWAP